VGWRLGEYGDKFIGVCTEAKRVMGSEAADWSESRKLVFHARILVFFHLRKYSNQRPDS
jgi:hypothetical protein